MYFSIFYTDHLIYLYIYIGTYNLIYIYTLIYHFVITSQCHCNVISANYTLLILCLFYYYLLIFLKRGIFHNSICALILLRTVFRGFDVSDVFIIFSKFD